MEGIFPVADLKAVHDLLVLKQAVEHAINLLHGPAVACGGMIEEARRHLQRSIGHTDARAVDVEGPWRDFVGE